MVKSFICSCFCEQEGQPRFVMGMLLLEMLLLTTRNLRLHEEMKATVQLKDFGFQETEATPQTSSR